MYFSIPMNMQFNRKKHLTHHKLYNIFHPCSSMINRQLTCIDQCFQFKYCTKPTGQYNYINFHCLCKYNCHHMWYHNLHLQVFFHFKLHNLNSRLNCNSLHYLIDTLNQRTNNNSSLAYFNFSVIFNSLDLCHL
jgi:hypothetical protein